MFVLTTENAFQLVPVIIPRASGAVVIPRPRRGR